MEKVLTYSQTFFSSNSMMISVKLYTLYHFLGYIDPRISNMASKFVIIWKMIVTAIFNVYKSPYDKIKQMRLQRPSFELFHYFALISTLFIAIVRIILGGRVHEFTCNYRYIQRWKHKQSAIPYFFITK